MSQTKIQPSRKQQIQIYGFNPIKNIFSSEKFSVKCQKHFETSIFFSQKQKTFLCRFVGAVSWDRFLKIIYRYFLYEHNMQTEILARKHKKIVDRIEPWIRGSDKFVYLDPDL